MSVHWGFSMEGGDSLKNETINLNRKIILKVLGEESK